MGLSKGLYIYVGILGGTAGVGRISDSFACTWDHFLPNGSPHPVMILGFVSCFIVICYAMFG